MIAPDSLPPLHVLATVNPDLLRAVVKMLADALTSAQADALQYR